MPHGPGIDDAEKLVREPAEQEGLDWRIGDGSLTRRWMLRRQGPAPTFVDEAAERAVRDAIANKTEDELSDASHLVGWFEASVGEVQESSLDLVSEDDYDQSRRAARKDERRFVAPFENQEQDIAA